MAKVWQIVKCGGLKYKIETVSDEPFIIFDDGTKHYLLLLKRCNGSRDDWLIVNDAQLE